jgi:hypothetical protein
MRSPLSLETWAGCSILHGKHDQQRWRYAESGRGMGVGVSLAVMIVE